MRQCILFEIMLKTRITSLFNGKLVAVAFDRVALRMRWTKNKSSEHDTDDKIIKVLCFPFKWHPIWPIFIQYLISISITSLLYSVKNCNFYTKRQQSMTAGNKSQTQYITLRWNESAAMDMSVYAVSIKLYLIPFVKINRRKIATATRIWKLFIQ